MAIVSAKEVIGIGRQSAKGSVASAFDMVVTDAGSFSASENYEQILDTGRRGTDAMDFGAYQGVGFTEITLEFPLMYGASTPATLATGSVFGILLRNFLSTGGGALPATGETPDTTEKRASMRHQRVAATKTTMDSYFRLGNTKEYLSIARNIIGGEGDAQWLDCRVTDMGISMSAGEGAVTVTASLTGQPATVVSAETTIRQTKTLSNDIALGWANSASGTAKYQPTLMGTTLTGNDARLISFELTMTREGSTIYTLGNTQDFSDIYLGPLAVTWSAIAEVNATELAFLRNRNSSGVLSSANQAIQMDGGKKTQVAVSQGTENDNDERSLIIGMTASTPFEAPLELDTSGAYSTVSISARALTTGANLPVSGDTYDGTTATATNKSPIEFQLTESGVNATTPPTY